MRAKFFLGALVYGFMVLVVRGEGDKPLPAAVGKATMAYGDELNKAQAEYAERVAAANKKYVEALDAAITAASRAGDAALAAQIQRMKESAQADLVADRTAPRSVGNRFYLSDMEESDDSAAMFGLGKKGRLGDAKIIVGGKYSPNGLGMHPVAKGSDAHATFRLNGQFKTFRAGAALNDSSAGAGSPMTFKVFGDNVLLWKSGPVRKRGDLGICNVSVAGVRLLKLVVECADNIDSAHAVWVEPVVAR